MSYLCVGKQEGFECRAVSSAKVLASLAERIRLGGFHQQQDKQIERVFRSRTKQTRFWL